jgi:hypothetical protein
METSSDASAGQGRLRHALASGYTIRSYLLRQGNRFVDDDEARGITARPAEARRPRVNWGVDGKREGRERGGREG